jgi:uracil-DNA glycosylase family 4
LLVVGEAAGASEALKGKPFVGQAGVMLDQLLAQAGVARADVRCANVLCCRPPSNDLVGMPYEYGAIEACRGLLEEEVARSRPRAIVALGNVAMRALTGRSGITRYRGFPVRHASGAWVVPTFHPSYLLPRKGQRDTARLTGAVILDIKKAARIAEGGFAIAKPVYLKDPTPAEAMLWAVRFEVACTEGSAKYLSSDIETAGKVFAGDDETDEDGEMDDPRRMVITRIGFAYAPGVAMSVPWEPRYKDVVRRLLSQTAVPHVVWNGYAFDVPVLAAQGMEYAGEVVDAMWAWHHLQSGLPRGLESVTSHYAYDLEPWKHLGAADPPQYNATDADAAGRNYLGIREALEARGQWTRFKEHVVEIYPLLHRAGRVNGLEIAPPEREALREELIERKEALLREAQTVVPEELRAAAVYAKAPKGKPGTWVPAERKARARICAKCEAKSPRPSHFATCTDGYVTTVERVTPAVRWVPAWEELRGEALDKAVTAAGFNPISQKQMLRYAEAHKHGVGENWKTGKLQFDRKTRAKLVKRFGGRHRIYEISQDLQDVVKTLGTYVEGFAPDARGRVYTTYTFAPATGRLASQNVNLQNVGKHTANPWAKQIRGMLRPPMGLVLVEADSSAIEAVLTGYFAEDAGYVRLARQGVHDFVTCMELGREFDTARLSEYKRDSAYAVARERNKRVVHMTNYGATPKMMRMQYPETFPTERTAAAAQERYLQACPALGPWQHRTRVIAHRQHYLENPWGYRQYFYAVFVKGPGGEVELGEDAKRAVAFLPQSSAAAFMRETLRIVGRSEYAECAPGNLSIHDSVCLAVPERHVTEAVEWIAQVMTRPIAELGGLRIGCEVAVGENWKDMRVAKRVVVDEEETV